VFTAGILERRGSSKRKEFSPSDDCEETRRTVQLGCVCDRTDAASVLLRGPKQVLGVKKQGTKTLYEVKWEGYPDSQNTWEPAANLRNCESFLEFLASHELPTKKPKVGGA
jgi:hypothetical protein